MEMRLQGGVKSISTVGWEYGPECEESVLAGGGPRAWHKMGDVVHTGGIQQSITSRNCLSSRAPKASSSRPETLQHRTKMSRTGKLGSETHTWHQP
ncbi:MAG: hypothetical protein FRX49_08088 [Trebouxia sp. A1-2]|nr:MAG: hypothetical protein FRX49_08088 [Trebouxia sp. A1-2]